MDTKVRNFPFFVFEGLDGAGKTTLARIFAERQGFSYYTSIPSNLLSLRPQVDATSSSIATFHFYSLCNSLRSQEYRLQLENSGVVADRYVFSTFAYHSLLIQHDLSRYFRILQCDNDFLLPDVVIYVTASDEVIRRRIANRSQSVPIQWYGDSVSLNFNLDESYKQILELVNIPVIQVDTSERAPEEAYNFLCQALNKSVKNLPLIFNHLHL